MTARTIRLGRTGVQVPVIGLGTWSFGGLNVNRGVSVGWAGHDDGQAQAALATAYELGLTHWDTADVYGNGRSERLIGTMWSSVPRSRIFLATKFGYHRGPAEHPYEPSFMRARLEESLRNLRTDVIDLYYLHHCDFGPQDRQLEGAVATARRFQKEGKVRWIGLSDWDARRIRRYADVVDPDVVQTYRNVVDDDYEASGLRRWVEDNDRGVVFFSPLRHGLLLGKYAAPVEFPEGDFRRNVTGFRDPETIRRMQQARQALIERFPNHREPVLHGLCGALLSGQKNACVLVGLRNPDQVRAAATIGEPLSAEEAAWVRARYVA
ncbi:MAG: aldo/keto reductase [Myxococcales bacterium]|nr:aldo/keto reductase [Myxococcota bacterium]MDW8281899.1 aldo/keto reductase [Myxococcales bacterium]